MNLKTLRKWNIPDTGLSTTSLSIHWGRWRHTASFLKSLLLLCKELLTRNWRCFNSSNSRYLVHTSADRHNCLVLGYTYTIFCGAGQISQGAGKLYLLLWGISRFLTGCPPKWSLVSFSTLVRWIESINDFFKVSSRLAILS